MIVFICHYHGLLYVNIGHFYAYNCHLHSNIISKGAQLANAHALPVILVPKPQNLEFRDLKVSRPLSLDIFKSLKPFFYYYFSLKNYFWPLSLEFSSCTASF